MIIKLQYRTDNAKRDIVVRILYMSNSNIFRTDEQQNDPLNRI